MFFFKLSTLQDVSCCKTHSSLRLFIVWVDKTRVHLFSKNILDLILFSLFLKNTDLKVIILALGLVSEISEHIIQVRFKIRFLNTLINK